MHKLWFLSLIVSSAAFPFAVEEFQAPIGCEGYYYCTGDSQMRGKISSNYRHWSQSGCLSDLQSQVSSACGGRPNVSHVRYYNHPQQQPSQPGGGGSTSSAGCPRTDKWDWWVALVVTEGGGSGMSAHPVTRGSAVAKQDAESAARQTARKHGAPAAMTSILNGCVAYAFSRTTWSSYLATACSRSGAESQALNACRGECYVKNSMCAWD